MKLVIKDYNSYNKSIRKIATRCLRNKWQIVNRQNLSERPFLETWLTKNRIVNCRLVSFSLKEIKRTLTKKKGICKWGRPKKKVPCSDWDDICINHFTVSWYDVNFALSTCRENFNKSISWISFIVLVSVVSLLCCIQNIT